MAIIFSQFQNVSAYYERGRVMEDTMKREQAEAIATLMKANRAFDRIFGIQEEEICDECGEIHEEDFNG